MVPSNSALDGDPGLLREVEIWGSERPIAANSHPLRSVNMSTSVR